MVKQLEGAGRASEAGQKMTAQKMTPGFWFPGGKYKMTFSLGGDGRSRTSAPRVISRAWVALYLSICPSIRQIFTEHWLCPAFGNPAVNKTRHPDFAELTFHTGWKRRQCFVNSYYVLGISPTWFLCLSSPKVGSIAPRFQIPTCEVWRGEVKCPRSPAQGWWWHWNSDSTCWILFPHPHFSIEGPSKRFVLLCGDLIPYLGLPDDRTCVFSILAPHGSHILPNG